MQSNLSALLVDRGQLVRYESKALSVFSSLTGCLECKMSPTPKITQFYVRVYSKDILPT